MVSKILSFINSALGKIMFFLPNSPFDSIINSIDKIDVLKYLSWIIPFEQIIAVSEAWLVSITIFYIYSVILRWVKAIE